MTGQYFYWITSLWILRACIEVMLAYGHKHKDISQRLLRYSLKILLQTWYWDRKNIDVRILWWHPAKAHVVAAERKTPLKLHKKLQLFCPTFTAWVSRTSRRCWPAIALLLLWLKTTTILPVLKLNKYQHTFKQLNLLLSRF